MKKLKISELNNADYKEIDKIFRAAKASNQFGTSEDIVNCVLAFCCWIDHSNFECVEFDVSWEVDKGSMH